MKQKEILLILVSIFVLVLIWIALSIYHNAVTSTIPQALSIQIAPISPDFDKETLEKIKKRKVVQPSWEFEKKSEEKSATLEAEQIIPQQASPSANQAEETISP